MNTLRIAARILTGGVFIFSGTVKAIDPSGSAFKFSDYFQAFGLDFLQPLSLAFAVLLCLAEFITGFAVLTGIRYKEGLWGVTILMALFTPLTLVLAITNPVSDCGCFGDAIKLTNWETFGKNVVILALVIFLFINRKDRKEYLSASGSLSFICAASLIFVGFAFYNIRYLPVIDFLPFREGNNIRQQMTIPEGVPLPKYETTLIYEKDGVQNEFTIDNYPADDTSWIFVDQRSVLVEKGYEPPVHSFTIVTSDGRDITDSVLDNPGYSLLMISRKLEDAKQKRLIKGFAAGAGFEKSGAGFLVLTSSGTETMEKAGTGTGIRFCQVDETILKTMIRSNPGYLLLKNGTVIRKWSWAGFPYDPGKLEKELTRE